MKRWFLYSVLAIFLTSPLLGVQSLRAEDAFLTAIARRECRCIERLYEDQEYEAKAFQARKGSLLGRFCSRLEEAEGFRPAINCRERVRGFEKSEKICPEICLKTAETPRLTDAEREKRKRQAIQVLRLEYQKSLSPAVWKTLNQQRPNWMPVFHISGEEGYEWNLRPYSSFDFESPRPSRGAEHFHSVVLFHEPNPKQLGEPLGWIGVFEKETGKPLKWLEYPPMSTYSDSVLREGKIVFDKKKPTQFFLHLVESGVFDQAVKVFGPIGACASEVDPDPDRFQDFRAPSKKGR